MAVTHERHINDTRTVLPFTLQQKNAAGTLTAVDLTGMTVEFKMVDQFGVEVIAQTNTGITVTTEASGEGQYDFSSAGVDEAGTYYGYVVVTDSGEPDHFPAEARGLVIVIHGDA